MVILDKLLQLLDVLDTGQVLLHARQARQVRVVTLLEVCQHPVWLQINRKMVKAI